MADLKRDEVVCKGMCKKRERSMSKGIGQGRRKRQMEPVAVDWFDFLPDDLLLSILSKLSSTARSPSDLINPLLTCKRMQRLAMNSMVLAKASKEALTVKAAKWSENTHGFLKLCCDSGNAEASYILGMIQFYCLQNRASGALLIAKAAFKSHAPALYSLAVIQFNGSGGSKTKKDLLAGTVLCARASILGHVDALRELGHCLQDGYGIKQNVTLGRKYLIRANAGELAPLSKSHSSSDCGIAPTGTNLRYDVSPSEVHPANMFLREWLAVHDGDLGGGLRMCSHEGCGRPETRNCEFRRCSVCVAVIYCSRSCQGLDWKLRHKAACLPAEHLLAVPYNDGPEQS